MGLAGKLDKGVEGTKEQEVEVPKTRVLPSWASEHKATFGRGEGPRQPTMDPVTLQPLPAGEKCPLSTAKLSASTGGRRNTSHPSRVRLPLCEKRTHLREREGRAAHLFLEGP